MLLTTCCRQPNSMNVLETLCMSETWGAVPAWTFMLSEFWRPEVPCQAGLCWFLLEGLMESPSLPPSYFCWLSTPLSLQISRSPLQCHRAIFPAAHVIFVLDLNIPLHGRSPVTGWEPTHIVMRLHLQIPCGLVLTGIWGGVGGYILIIESLIGLLGWRLGRRRFITDGSKEGGF